MTTSSTTLQAICNAIELTLAPAITYTQSYNELKEGMADTPTLQIYPYSGSSNPPQKTDRWTFQAVVRLAELVIYADLYATQRSELSEDMAILLPLIEAMIDEIEKQDKKPYFSLLDANGEPAIKAFNWRWQYSNFTYNDPQQIYVGARFTFTLTMF